MSEAQQLVYRLQSAVDILESVTDVTGVSLAQMRGRNRMPMVTRCRHIAMTLMRARLSMSYQEIALHFMRDHTSVMDAVKRCDMTSREARAIAEYLDRPNSGARA